MTKEPFPGEREPNTAMGTQPGILGTTGYGGDLTLTDRDSTMDEDTTRERRREGGGDDRPPLLKRPIRPA